VSKREKAMLAACPKCGVGPGVRCLASKGHKRKSVHQERLTAKPDYKTLKRATDEGFYKSDQWRRLRYRVLLTASGACQACGARPSVGKALHVDHIMPVSRFPELALDERNLQVLCEDCNLGKGAHDMTDWRRS